MLLIGVWTVLFIGDEAVLFIGVWAVLFIGDGATLFIGVSAMLFIGMELCHLQVMGLWCL